MIERILDYSGKLRILRQIMSNKAWVLGRTNNAVKLGTVLVSSFLTFFGFTGVDKITSYALWLAPVTKDQVEFAFNLGVLALFILIILALVFRFSDREAEAWRAIVSLTHLINEADDLVFQAEQGFQITNNDVTMIREKYDMLIITLPANTDSEYLRAKKDFKAKEKGRMALQVSAHDVFDAVIQRRVVEALIRKSTQIMNVLEVLRKTDNRLYLAGGAIRNNVWDYLHGYASPTPVDDIDVIYFDSVSAEKSNDEILERKLHNELPNVCWSVKNQARMHIVNGEAAYTSLEDAICKWPETVTAIAARFTDEGLIEIVAPFGFDDLFRLIVEPTPHFKSKVEAYRERIERKKWEVIWPKLKFFDRQ